MSNSDPEKNEPLPSSAITPEATGRPPANRPLLDMTLVVLTVVVVAWAMSWFLGGNVDPEQRGGLETGRDMPNIVADGWLNGTAPTADQLEGKVVVVSAWFVDCPNCWAEAPALVKTHDAFRDRDVVFIGLTFDGADQLPDIEEFLSENGITWPNGYGALATLTDLNAEYFPAVWVIGRNGKVVWNYDSSGDLADGIELALSQE